VSGVKRGLKARPFVGEERHSKRIVHRIVSLTSVSLTITNTICPGHGKRSGKNNFFRSGLVWYDERQSVGTRKKFRNGRAVNERNRLLDILQPVVLRKRFELLAQFGDDFFQTLGIENASCFRQRAK